jgi:SRSO17 transposase
MDAGVVEDWADRLDEVMARAAGCLGRSEVRRRAAAYVRGLLGEGGRKNGWRLAEQAGDASPFGVQRLLGRASWDADALRDEVLRYAWQHLLAQGEGGVLVVDETGFLKKGDKSCGVQRQYSGTAGRIENCQVGVFLALVGSRGRCLVDRALYLPKSWAVDKPRRREAHVPDDVEFQTKPQLAMAMLKRALDAGMRPAWVLGDEVYGEWKLRWLLEDRGVPYVLAVGRDQRIWRDFRQVRVDRIADDAVAESWHRLSCGTGSKGERIYDWAAARLGIPADNGMIRWLLVRRQIAEPHERAFYLCCAPPDAGAAELAAAAGKRWAIESCFEAAKQETGLDEYEVRGWEGWHRHATLSMLALAFLAAVRAEAAEHAAGGKKGAVAWQTAPV